MLEHLEQLPTDPILGLMARFREDPEACKIDLGVGVYRDDRGETPVLAAVRQAEQAVLARQRTKSYVAAAGNAGFNEAMMQLVLGERHPAVQSGRVCAIQSPGGCGALRLGAELLRTASPDTMVHVSDPTWANHYPLLAGSGLRLETYPYYDSGTGAVRFESMLDSMDRLPARSVVLLHASCHNPTGADLSDAQWRELLPLFRRRELFPFIDLAYQGLGRGVVEDVAAIRLFCEELPEAAIAISCSKNFGLYRERTGCLLVLGTTAATSQAALSQLVKKARSIYSMPPDHGAAIVLEILADRGLSEQWRGELAGMRERIRGLRRDLVERLKMVCRERDFGFIAAQQGLFSFLGISLAQVRELRERHHVYLTDDSRINVAGLRADNLEYFVQAVARVVRE